VVEKNAILQTWIALAISYKLYAFLTHFPLRPPWIMNFMLIMFTYRIDLSSSTEAIPGNYFFSSTFHQ